MGIIFLPLLLVVIVFLTGPLLVSIFAFVKCENNKYLMLLLGLILGFGGFIVITMIQIGNNTEVSAFGSLLDIFIITGIISIPIFIFSLILLFIKNSVARQISGSLSTGIIFFFIFSLLLSNILYDILGVKMHY